MVETASLAIHPDFIRWYRTLSVEENRERLEKRFKGLQVLIKAATFADIEGLVKCAFGSTQRPTADMLTRFNSWFKQSDDLFDVRDGERELEILSACALALLLEHDSYLSSLAAMSIFTTSCGGARSANIPMDLLSLSQGTLLKNGEHRRKRPDINEQKFAGPRLADLEPAKTKMTQSFSPDTVGPAFDLLAENLKKTLAAIIQQSNTAVSQLAEYLKVQDEELNLLWWVFGEQSTDLETAFKDIPAEQRLLVLAKEMADKTLFMPGPVSVKALLSRAGISQKKTKLTAAVNACQLNWLELLKLPAQLSPVLFPLHFAIARRLETKDESSWIAGWSATTGIDQNYSLPALSLSQLFYSEQLILQFEKRG